MEKLTVYYYKNKPSYQFSHEANLFVFDGILKCQGSSCIGKKSNKILQKKDFGVMIVKLRTVVLSFSVRKYDTEL